MFAYSFGNKSLESQLDAMGIRAAFDANLTKAVSDAKELADKDLLPFARQSGIGSDMVPMNAAAKRITDTSNDLVILGTGGSSLGAQAAIALARYRRQGTGTRIHTPDSLCPFEMDYLFATLNPKSTHVLTISKSGKTAETLAQLLVFRAWLEAVVQVDSLADHFTFITDPGIRPLRRYAEKLGAPILDDPTDIGGRFSVLTKVGMLTKASYKVTYRSKRRINSQYPVVQPVIEV
jgi:glucose-6-phosphate isomerase